MGQNQTREVRNNITRNVTNSATQRTITDLAVNTNSIVRNAQNISLRVIGEVVGNINLFQNISSVVDISNVVNSVTSSVLAADMRNALKEDINQSIRKVTDGLAIFTNPDNQRILNEIIDVVDNQVDNIVTDNTVSNILMDNNSLQNAVLEIEGKNLGDINVDQNVQINQTAENIVERVLESTLDSNQVNDLISQINTSSETIEESPITNIANTIKSTSRMAFNTIAAIILWILAIVALVFAFFLTNFGVRIVIIIFAIILAAAGVYFIWSGNKSLPVGRRQNNGLYNGRGYRGSQRWEME